MSPFIPKQPTARVKLRMIPFQELETMLGEWMISDYQNEEARQKYFTKKERVEDEDFLNSMTTGFHIPTINLKSRLIRYLHNLETKELQKKLSNIRTVYSDVREQIEHEIRTEIEAIEISTYLDTRPAKVFKKTESAKIRLIESPNNDLCEKDFELVGLTKPQLKTYLERMWDEYEKNIGGWIFSEAANGNGLALPRNETIDPITEPPSLQALRKRQRKVSAALELALSLVGKYSIKRATMRQMAERRKMDEANQHFINTREIYNSATKKSFPLSDVVKGKKEKLAEIYAFAAGIQSTCEAQGMTWASVVVTLPGRFHPNPTKGKKSWNHTLPDASLRLLRERWELLRAYLNKYNIVLVGLWTVEAQEDATPHINYLVYFKPEDAKFVHEAFCKYFAGSFNSSERAVRFKINGDVVEGQKIASFASYALKYFIKSFTGDEEKDQKHNDMARGEEAWASSFGIRRYSFFGIPPLTGWRRLRASTTAPNDRGLEELWRAARESNAGEYIKLNGGLGIKNSDRPFQNVSFDTHAIKMTKVYKTSVHRTRVRNTRAHSKTVIGVVNTKNGNEFITKKIGEWEIRKFVEEVKEVHSVKKEEQKQIVTDKPIYPSNSPAAASEPDFNSYFAPVFHRYPTNSPPLLH